jgi:hypothetical protein
MPRLNDHLNLIAVLAKSFADENRLRIPLCVSGGE